MSHVESWEQPYHKALSALVEQLQDPSWVVKNLFVGQPSGIMNDRCLEALRLRRIVEEIKGSSEGIRVNRTANRLTLVNVILTLVIAISTLVNVVVNWR